MTTIPHVIAQHAEEAAFLWLLRDAAVGAPHYDLKDLSELDYRVEAHLDGLRLAGDAGWEMVKQELAWEEPGEVFAAGVLAFESGDDARIASVLEVACTDLELARGAVSALGWLNFERAKPHIKALITNEDPARWRIGLAAAAAHRQHPKSQLIQALQHDDLQLSARALQAAGELGRIELLPTAQQQCGHEDADVQFWAAWTAALLGDPRASVPLLAVAMEGGEHAEHAADLAARRMDHAAVASWLQTFAADPMRQRLAVIMAGAAGDPGVVDWLIGIMDNDDLARPAGEAFSMITGVDLAYEDLERDQPEEVEAGPNDDPEDEEVDLDVDEDLPWPDQQLVADWWQTNGSNFNPGTRYLLGQSITPESLQQALATGRQRQRAAAALELSLLQPGQPLFETRAPGYRQRQLLAGP